jgi:hypothetical protein
MTELEVRVTASEKVIRIGCVQVNGTVVRAHCLFVAVQFGQTLAPLMMHIRRRRFGTQRNGFGIAGQRGEVFGVAEGLIGRSQFGLCLCFGRHVPE